MRHPFDKLRAGFVFFVRFVVQNKHLRMAGRRLYRYSSNFDPRLTTHQQNVLG